MSVFQKFCDEMKIVQDQIDELREKLLLCVQGSAEDCDLEDEIFFLEEQMVYLENDMYEYINSDG